MSALRSAGTNRPSSVSTAMPMSTCGCSVRVSFSPSNQALSAGTVLQATHDRAHQARGDVVARHPGVDVGVVAERGRHDLACASAMTRAMLRRTPLSCSGWPLGRPRPAAGCASACRRPTAAYAVRRRRAAGAGAAAAGAATAAACRRSADLGAAIGGGLLDVGHGHRAIGAGGAHAGEVDAELARGGAHRRHRLDPADGDAPVRHARHRRSASRRPRCRHRRARRRAWRSRRRRLTRHLVRLRGGGLAGCWVRAASARHAPWLWPVSWPSARCGMFGSSLELGQHAAGDDDVAFAAGQLQHLAGDRRGHFDHGLGGLHRHQRRRRARWCRLP